MRRLIRAAAALPLPIVIIVLWYSLSRDSTSPYWPPLSEIVSDFHRIWIFAGLRTELLPSLEHLFLGFVLASLAGVILGLLVSQNRVLRQLLSPLLAFGRSLSSIAVLPLAVVFLGIGSTMKVCLIAYACFWPVLLNTIDGVRGVDPAMLDVARVYQISRWSTILRFVLPAAMPQIFQGLRTSLSLGVTVIVFSEFVGGDHGVGYFIEQAQQSFAIPDMWTGMILLGLLGYLLAIALRAIDHRILHWYYGRQEANRG